MGKFIGLVLVAGALVGAALFVPVSGRSFWDRAVERGIPRAAARGVARGLRAGWDFVASIPQKASSSGAVKDTGTRKAAVHSPPGKPPPRTVARAAPVQVAPVKPAPAAVAGAGAPPPRSRDGIIAQPHKEALHEGDRAALDQLISARR